MNILSHRLSVLMLGMFLLSFISHNMATLTYVTDVLAYPKGDSTVESAWPIIKLVF